MRYEAFLLTFDTTQISRDALLQGIDNIDEIANWYAFLPASVCLVSKLTASDLSRLIKLRFRELRFLVVKLERGQRQGWLPRSVWDFMKEARPARKVDSAAE